MSDTVEFVADVDLNATIRIQGVGSFVIHGPVRGTALPAGTPFPVPAGPIADAFEQHYGPRPGDASVTPGAAAEGLIPGLRRIG